MSNFADIIDWASKAGTLPMQGLMLIALIVLGWVIRHLHNRSDEKIDALHIENKKTQQEWEQKVEIERAAVAVERKDRINLLIEIIREDTKIKAELKNAIDNNTQAIERLEKLLSQFMEKRR